MIYYNEEHYRNTFKIPPKNLERNKINTLYTQMHNHPGYEQALKLKVAG